jgi:hypothetical protein
MIHFEISYSIFEPNVELKALHTYWTSVIVNASSQND